MGSRRFRGRRAVGEGVGQGAGNTSNLNWVGQAGVLWWLGRGQGVGGYKVVVRV